jgi:putative DNA primase/helicase
MTDTTSANAVTDASGSAESAADAEAIEAFDLDFISRFAADNAAPVARPATSGNASDAKAGLPPGITAEDLAAAAARSARFRALDAALRGEPMSDLGNAYRLLAHAGRDMRYVADTGVWIAYDQARGYWVPCEDGSTPRRVWHEVTEVMKESALALAAEAGGDEDTKKAAAALLKYATRSQNGGAINAVVEVAATLEGFRVTSDQLDAAPHLLQCTNGVVNLDTGELLQSGPDFFHTRSTAVPYVKGARSALLDAFLSRMFGGDETKVAWFAQLMKASIRGDNKNRLVVVMCGPSCSGKTTSSGLMARTLGGYRTPFSMSMLRGNFDEKPRPDLIRVLNHRVVTTEEIAVNEELHADQIKRLASGDGEISVRTLYRGEVAVKPKFTPWLMVNDVPAIAGADPATINRLRILTTADAQFNGSDVIPLNDDQVAEAFLAWMLEAVDVDFADRRDVPASALDDQQDAADLMFGPLAQWVKEQCVTGAKDECWGFSRHLYRSAIEWYEKNSLDPYDRHDKPDALKSDVAFGKWLKSMQYQCPRRRVPVVGRPGTVSKAVYGGIGLKADPQPAFDPDDKR